jgi:hypothetical protein
MGNLSEIGKRLMALDTFVIKEVLTVEIDWMAQKESINF